MDQTNKEVLPENSSVIQAVQPPLEAYLYFPPKEDVKYKSGKKALRRIFDGQIELDSDDLKQLQIFTERCVKQKYVVDTVKWSPSLQFRFLQGNDFNSDKTFKSMQEYDEWRKRLPILYSETIEKYLGRDSRFRPLIVLNAYKIDLKLMDLESQLNGLTYFLELVVNNMLLPGQVENWVIVMDLNFKGITDLPINALKTVMGYLQGNYRSRLYRMYIVNTPSSLMLTWGILKAFLDENTVNKICFIKEGKIDELFQHTNKAQAEIKYGGSQPNKTEFWPPVLTQENIFLENDTIKLLSKQMYTVLYKDGRLVNNKTLPILVQQEVTQNNDVTNNKPTDSLIEEVKSS